MREKNDAGPKSKGNLSTYEKTKLQKPISIQ